MRIYVCLKHVPDGRLRFDAAGKRIDRSAAGDLNPADAHATEEALRIIEGTDGEVIVISMGPDPASESLRGALAMGADRAILVTDPALEGSDLVGTSTVLAKVIGRDNPDLVIFGKQSSDAVGGVLWQAVAERLRLPFVSQVIGLSSTDTVFRATRQTEYGDDVIEVALPAVISVGDAINEPRHASLKGKMAAKKKSFEVLSLRELDISASDVGEAGSKTVVLAISPPPARMNAVKIVDSGDGANAILDYLVEKELV